MKKLLACASLAVAMMLSTSAMAAVESDANIIAEDGVVFNADLDGSAYKTVLIYKGETTDEPTESNVEYVDTYTTAIDGATMFALKNEGALGKYVMMLGGAGTLAKPEAAVKVAFEIKEDVIPPTYTKLAMTAAGVSGEGDTRNLGFTLGAVDAAAYNTVVLEYNGTKLAWSLDDIFGTISGEAVIDAALEIQNVPVAVAEGTVSVYFSDYVIGGTN